MVIPLLAAMAIGGALGGLGGKQKAKAAGKPTTITSRSQLNPAMQLGGWDRLNEALNRMRDIQPYRPGMNNPYLGATFGHILGRAGIPTPEGGWQQQFQPPPMMQPPQGPPSGPPGLPGGPPGMPQQPPMMGAGNPYLGGGGLRY
jgi:hypothetical protein